MKPVDPETLKQRMSEHAKEQNPESFRNLWRSLKAVFRNGLDYGQGNPLTGIWRHWMALHRQYRARRSRACSTPKIHRSTCQSFWRTRNEDFSSRI
ncbi:MAG: hypothetical protein AAF399_10905 [Bacteroidota bacterium]